MHYKKHKNFLQNKYLSSILDSGSKKESSGHNGNTRQADTLTVRMSPRTKYGLDLIARSHGRTLASIAEWPCIEGMKTQQLTSPHGDKRPVEHVLEELWDPHEPHRFVKLALHDPSLLDYHESLIWKVIDEAPSF